MNIPQLLNAFASLSLNGADISVERHWNNEFRVSGVLHLASDDELEQSASFVIDADRNSHTLVLSLTFVTVDTELQQTFYDGQVNLTGADAWDHSCKLHNAIKSLIAEPETTPPACEIETIHTIGSCQLTKVTEPGCDAKYVMAGPSGTHSLDVDSTDRKRLEAHWKGFLRNNGIEDADASKALDKALTVQIQPSFGAVHDILECFDAAGCDLPKKWDDFFQCGLNKFDLEKLDTNHGCVLYTMSIRDAKALRNRAHRAAKAWISEHGDDWYNHVLEDLRDTLDRELVTA
jgi:hypothetical protein